MAKIAFLILISVVVSACGQMNTPSEKGFSESPQPEVTEVPEVPQLFKAEPLAWESLKNPERVQWSKELLRIVENHFVNLDRAQDIEMFCPTYDSLSRLERINVWANLIASVTYFESGWNPASHSVDVGRPDQRDTWSVGLLQMSVVDQRNYRLTFGYTFTDLQKAVPNLELGMAILARQIVKYGVIAIPVGGKGLYWAVLHPGGKYDRTAQIAKMSAKIRFCR